MVVVGAVAIWLAHSLSRLVTKGAWRHLRLTRADIASELRGSWSIALRRHSGHLHLPAGRYSACGRCTWRSCSPTWSEWSPWPSSESGTAGGRDRPLRRRILYVGGLVAVGLTIVVLESLVHLL